MTKEEIQDILEELHLVRPEILQPKAKKLFEAIMIIADERDELQQRIDKAINNLEKSIESINNKLADKEIRVENGRIINPINDYRIVRLKTIKTKSKEILDILKEVEQQC